MAIGIDIGSTTTRVAVVESAGKGYRVTGYARLPTSEVLGGAARLGEALAAAGVARGAAAVSASGRDVILKISNYPLVPEWRLRLLIDYELGELSDRAGGDILSASRVLSIPGRARGEYTALLALAKEPYIEERIGALTAAGLKLDGAVPSAVAIGNAYAATRGGGAEMRTVMVVDVGAETTDVALVHGTAVIFARNANFGGTAFVNAVAETFGVKPQTAAKMILEEGSLEVGGSSTRQAKLARALEGVASDLANLLRSSTKFSQAQLRASDLGIDELVLAGGVARLPGLDRYLAQALRMSVSTFDVVDAAAPELEASALAALKDDGPASVTAFGLAVTAAGDRNLIGLKLLPHRLERRRKFLEQQLWIYLATGVSVFAALLLYATVANNRDVEAQRATSLRKEAEALAALRSGLESSLEERRIVAESRTSWASVIDSGKAASVVLAALRRSTPADAYLTGVVLEPRSEYGKPPTLTVQGRIRESTKSVSAIYEELADSVRSLVGFEFTTSELKHDEDGSGLNFSFKLVFTGAPPPAPAEAGEGG